MVEVYFENIHTEIIRHISTSRKEIKICVAWFTDMDIYNCILEIQKKGTKVNVIIANHEFNKKSKVDFKELLKNNGYVGYIGDINNGSTDKLMHNKFCIIDNQKVITGSYNWTKKARLNDENIIVIEGQSNVINKFIEKYEKLKPKFGFALTGNSVKLLPIDQIMSKWEKANTVSRIEPTMPHTKKILDKF